MAGKSPQEAVPGIYGVRPGQMSINLDNKQEAAGRFYDKPIIPLEVHFDGQPKWLSFCCFIRTSVTCTCPPLMQNSWSRSSNCKHQHEDRPQFRQYPYFMLLANNKCKPRVHKGQCNKPKGQTVVKQFDMDALLAHFNILEKMPTDKREPWNFVAPQSNGFQTKQKEGTTYHGCPSHGTAGISTVNDSSTCYNAKNSNHPSHNSKGHTPTVVKTALASINEGFSNPKKNNNDDE